MNKDTSRESRLSFKKFEEHQLRGEFKQDALDKCQLQLQAFAECGKESGLMVVWNCQEFQKDVHDCMKLYMSDDQWELYKKNHSSAKLKK